MRRIIIISLVLVLNSCAYIFQDTKQDLIISTSNDISFDTLCSANNEEGEWKNIIPQQTTYVHRDGNELKILCENESQSGTATLKPKFMANILMADVLRDLCTISCLIDASLNTLYEYPKNINVKMENKP